MLTLLLCLEKQKKLLEELPDSLTLMEWLLFSYKKEGFMKGLQTGRLILKYCAAKVVVSLMLAISRKKQNNQAEEGKRTIGKGTKA
ncbi:hypothetical protein K1719_039738 [Acacia pycnantha]|nr:hypothetical protein K1719_039738 [Acacia pycnantha]